MKKFFEKPQEEDKSSKFLPTEVREKFCPGSKPGCCVEPELPLPQNIQQPQSSSKNKPKP